MNLSSILGKYKVSPGVVISHPENTIIGDGTSIGYNALIFAGDNGQISIGKNCLIGHGSILRAENHRFDRTDIPIIEQGHEPGSIVIEEDCWIGSHVVVLPNVTIGKGSVIGAGAVVTRDIPEYSVAVGVPAKVIRKRK